MSMSTPIVIQGIFQRLNATQADWNNTSVPIPYGLITIDSSTGIIKIGDGVTLYANLKTLCNINDYINLFNILNSKADTTNATFTESCNVPDLATDNNSSGAANTRFVNAAITTALSEITQTVGTGQSDLTNELVTFEQSVDSSIAQIIQDLNSYEKITDLDTTLLDYVTLDALNKILAEYSPAGDYVMSDNISTYLTDYVTNKILTATLQNYVTNTALATALANIDLSEYVSTTVLNTTLEDYTSNVSANSNTPFNSIRVVGTGTTPADKFIDASNGYFRIMDNTDAGNALMTIDTSGNLVALANLTAYSDIKLKKDLKVIEDSISKIKQLTGYTYTRIDTGERQSGLIAQDIQKVLPEVVINNNDTLSVAYGNMMGIIVEAIKDIDRRLSIIENK